MFQRAFFCRRFLQWFRGAALADLSRAWPAKPTSSDVTPCGRERDLGPTDAVQRFRNAECLAADVLEEVDLYPTAVSFALKKNPSEQNRSEGFLEIMPKASTLLCNA